MSTMDPSRVLDLEQARAYIAQQVYGERLGGDELGQVGLEPEYIVFRLGPDGAPVGRFPLEGPSSVLQCLEDLVGRPDGLTVDSVGPPPVYTLADGGRITFEPGGQVEHSTTVHATAAIAMADVDRIAGVLHRSFQGEGASLASVGLDLWTDRSLVEQQLRAPRYFAMAEYFKSRSEHGRLMMRHSGSFQVNLDLGERSVAEERWRLANLLTPIAVASFSCSPEAGWVSRRAWAWQGLDPTRTGFPSCLLAGERSDPGYCYADFALNADVLLFRDKQSAGATPGRAGFRFRDWMEAGHPVHGSPEWDDLDYHLSTLFPEVRLRGFFEIRSADGMPLHLRAAQVVFWVGLLYDGEARASSLEYLEPFVTDLQEDWVAAAHHGFGHPRLGERAIQVWERAIDGARRLPEGYFRSEDLAAAEEFMEKYVRQERSPGDELRVLLDQDPAEALRWSL